MRWRGLGSYSRILRGVYLTPKEAINEEDDEDAFGMWK